MQAIGIIKHESDVRAWIQLFHVRKDDYIFDFEEEILQFDSVALHGV